MTTFTDPDKKRNEPDAIIKTNSGGTMQVFNLVKNGKIDFDGLLRHLEED